MRKEIYGEYVMTEGNNVDGVIKVLKLALKQLRKQRRKIKYVESFQIIIKKAEPPLAIHDTVGYKFYTEVES